MSNNNKITPEITKAMVIAADSEESAQRECQEDQHPIKQQYSNSSQKLEDIENHIQIDEGKTKGQTKNEHYLRLYVGSKSIVSSERNWLASRAQSHSNFSYVRQKAGVKKVVNYFDIIVRDPQEKYTIPNKVYDQNYKDILIHFGKAIVVDKNEEKSLLDLEVITFDSNRIPNENMTIQEFLNHQYYKNKLFRLVFSFVVPNCQFLELDNYKKSDEDNLDILKFRIKFKPNETYENLKRFFKVLSTKNVLFENVRKLKIVIEKPEEMKSLLQVFKKSSQQCKPNKEKYTEIVKGMKSLSETFESQEESTLNYLKCKEIVRKIYRQLCTQNLINNLDLVEVKEAKQKEQIDDIQKHTKCMTQISKRHLLMCQNEKMYEDMKKKKLKQQYKKENILPNFEHFNMVSLFTIKKTKQFVDEILESSFNFSIALLKISFVIFSWTFIGTIIPFKAMFFSIDEINTYFNAGSNIKTKHQFIPSILIYCLQQGLRQISLAVSLIFICINLANYSKLSDSGQNLVIFFMLYWLYQIFIYAILKLAGLVSDYFFILNAFTEDMYDINQYQVSQKSYYIEFLENIEDTYMRNILPIIPKKDEAINKLGLIIGPSLKKASRIKIIGKQWVSVQMLSSRYIYEPEPIASKDPDQIVESVYELARPGSYTELLQSLKLYFLILLRAVAIPVGLSQYKGGFTNISVLLMIIIQSLLLYNFNLIPSGLNILEGQKIKLRYLKRVINLITSKELSGTPREVPIVNLFDITTLESWHNLARITYAKTRRVDVIKDMVELNQTYDTIIDELNGIIGLVTDISRNLPEMIYNVENDSDDEEAGHLLGDDQDAVQDLLFKVGIYQLKRNAKIRLILSNRHPENTEFNEQLLLTDTKKYADDLLKKYNQVRSEFQHESIEKAETFLGLVKVDDKLVKQVIIAGLIAGFTSGIKIILEWLQNK